ncbi:MAG: hypothetical protein KBB01_01200 [Candidatus Omnitrophica bacterium]|jgi:hypothetical protein|nr:hypothetical protein [Candidatus Omnitrophota bacterium]
MLIKKLPLKKFDKKTICFVLYEKVDQWIYRPYFKKLSRLKKLRLKTFDGFSYDTYIKKHKINSRLFPASLADSKIDFLPPKSKNELLFSYLIKEKFYSLETRVLLKQINTTEKTLKETVRKYQPKLLVIPEDTDGVRGRLAATIAKINNIKTLVILPLYYEWITNYPLMAKRIADYWLTVGKNYEKRLLKNRIKPKHILKQNLPFKSNGVSKSSQKELNLYETEIKKGKYYLAALQNNDCQDVFIQMLIDSFRLLPCKTLVFKFHPATSEKEKKRLKNKYNLNNVYFLDKIDLNKLIRRSLGFFTISSSCIFTAVKSKKPVVIIDVDYFFLELLPLIRQTGCFKIASTPSELIAIISDLNNIKQKRRYLAKQTSMINYYLSRQCCPIKLIKKLAGL